MGSIHRSESEVAAMDADYVEGDINTIDGAVADDENYVDDESNEITSELPEAVLTYLAKSLASDAEAVVVEAEDRRGQIRLSLHVGPGDMGRVIGRRGRTAQAIRALVGVAGARTGVSTSVDIVDD
jgi:predicted RNA-binding protein YlqC (UPF0109 family)